MGGSQPGEGGPGNLRVPQIFPISSRPQIPLRDSIPKNYFWGVAVCGGVHLQYLL
jgi:hypothetical protein